MARRRAVITGIGIISPIGLDLVTFWEGLIHGRSGVRTLESLDHSRLPVHFGGEILDFEPKNYLEKKDRKRLSIMVRTIQFAVAAAQLAHQDANIDKDQLDPTRFGTVFGAATIPSELKDLGPAALATVGQIPVAPSLPGVRRNGAAIHEIDLQRWGELAIPVIPPMWMLSHIPNMVASHVSILHNAQGPNNTLTSTEMAGSLALGEARRHIFNDRADVFMVGSSDTLLTPIHYFRHILFDPLSRRNDDPAHACRPFDRHRDGKVLGEGAGLVILEELDHARRRGARIYAELVGFGAAYDKNLTGQGLARAIRVALDDAGLTPADIDHINAQGSSTVPGDAWEARGLQQAFGANMPPVFAAKSYFGHLGAGSPLVELGASLLALENGQLPPTLNYETPDPACPVNLNRTLQPVRKPNFLKISSTDLGQTVAIVCRKWEK